MRPRLMLVALSVLALAGCGQATSVAESSNLRLIENARRSGQPTVVEFGSDTCASCRTMMGVMDAAARRTAGRGHVLVMDVYKDRSVGPPFRIAMMPTQIFFDAGGREVGRHIGPLGEGEVVRRMGLDGAGR